MNATLRDAPTAGGVIRWAKAYDKAVGVISLGREAALRRQTIEKAAIRAGERVLDVGCGTGTLAIEAALYEPEAEIFGFDPAASMIARAREKAQARGANVRFDVGVIEAIDHPDASFDIVLSSLMLHHLPPSLQRQGLAEVLRVLRPGGRLVLVDFSGPGPLLHRLGSLLPLGHTRHRHEPPDDGAQHEAHDRLTHLLSDVGFEGQERSQLKPKYLFCMLAHKPQ